MYAIRSYYVLVKEYHRGNKSHFKKSTVKKMSDTEKKIIHLHKIIDTIRSINSILNSEEKPKLMIKNVCDVLVNIRKYYYSWILLFDEKKEIKFLEAAGPNEEIEEIKSWIRKGNLPA